MTISCYVSLWNKLNYVWFHLESLFNNTISSLLRGISGELVHDKPSCKAYHWDRNSEYHENPRQGQLQHCSQLKRFVENLNSLISFAEWALKPYDLGPVHTNPFSNENGAVLLRFQKDLRPHILFSYRFRPSTLQRHICLKTLLYPQCAWSNELDACAFQCIGPRNWREIEAVW